MNAGWAGNRGHSARRLGVVVAFAALLPALATHAAAMPGVADRLLRLRVLDQSFAVGTDDDFTATFELTGSQDDIAAVRDAMTPTTAPESPPTPSSTVATTTTSPTSPAPTTTSVAVTAPASPTPTNTTSAASASPAIGGAGADDLAGSVTITAYEAITSIDRLIVLDEQGPTKAVDRVTLAAADVLTFGDGIASGELAVPVGIVAPTGAATSSIDLDRPGIYPVTIDVQIAGEIVASSLTFIEVVDADESIGAPLAVSIVAGVDDPGPWPSPTELAGASIELAKLIELAEAVDGPLSIALPPVLVRRLTAAPDAGDATSETADAPETSTPPTSEPSSGTTATTLGELPSRPGATSPAFAGIESPDALLDAFRADELLGVPAVALDPSALIEIDQRDLFTGQLRLGEDILSTASPRAVVSRAVWVSERPISADAVVMLRNLGIRMVVVSDDVAEALGVPTDAPAARPFGVNLGNDGALPAMTFSPLGAQLQTPLATQSTSTTNDNAVRLLVELQLSRVGADVPAIVLATPRVTVPDPAVTAQFVALANDMPDISVVPISRLPGLVDGALAGGASEPVTLPAVAGADLTSRLSAVTTAREDAVHASSMLVDSDRSSEWTAELDRVMSSEIDDATAFQQLQNTRADIDAVLGAIVPPDPFTFTLTGTSSTLRIRVQNTSSAPLNVQVLVRSPKLTFPEQPPVTTVPAGETTEIPVAVEARSNGTFTVEVDVLAPDNARLARPVILKARVSRVTGLSQVVTGGAVLVLVSWWYSHLRRNRRRRVAAAATASESTIPFDALAPDAAESLVAPPTTLRRHEISDARDGEQRRTTDPPDEPR